MGHYVTHFRVLVKHQRSTPSMKLQVPHRHWAVVSLPGSDGTASAAAVAAGAHCWPGGLQAPGDWFKGLRV